ncbi:hypothetical protein A2U01_0060470, partial [Trifolium medium]|nr:hypothetical protein [Trifolium medium]
MVGLSSTETPILEFQLLAEATQIGEDKGRLTRGYPQL